MIASIVIWRRSAHNNSVTSFLPNNICGIGFTLSGDLYVKKESSFQKMPLWGTRNVLQNSSDAKTEGDFLNVSVRFHIPYGLGLFTDIPANLIYKEDAFSLEHIFNNEELEIITEALFTAISDSEMVSVLESFILDKILYTLPPQLIPIVNYIHYSKGLTNVSYLASKFYVSERTMNRYFNKYIGISPISYINLIRFRSAMEPANGALLKKFDKAFDLGYYDESHLIKSFRAFTKSTPKKVFSSLQDGILSDFYNF